MRLLSTAEVSEFFGSRNFSKKGSESWLYPGVRAVISRFRDSSFAEFCRSSLGIFHLLRNFGTALRAIFRCVINNMPAKKKTAAAAAAAAPAVPVVPRNLEQLKIELNIPTFPPVKRHFPVLHFKKCICASLFSSYLFSRYCSAFQQPFRM